MAERLGTGLQTQQHSFKSNYALRLIRYYIKCFIYLIYCPIVEPKTVKKNWVWKIKFKRFRNKIWNKIIYNIFIIK